MISDHQPHIVVIGAGVSGISAAAHLHQGGLTNITVLEGTKRWGGRVRTETFGQSLIEVGANWIHGGSYANPIFNLANQSPDLLLHEGQIQRFSRKNGLFYRPGKKNVEKELGEIGFRLFFDIERQSAELYNQGKGKNETLAQWIENKFNEELDKVSDSEDKEILEDILWGMINYLRLHNGDELEFSSANLYGCFWDIPGGDVKIPGGYINVFQPLVDQIHDKIQFESEVIKIDQSQNKVCLTTRAGNDIECDHVILTASLGYLKENQATLFLPSLPDAKIEAINSIGFGRCGKIFLEFDKPFWAKGEEGLKIAWGKDAIKSQRYPEEWYKSIFGFDEVLNNPNVLLAWIGGEGAEIMENLEDAEIISAVTKVLQSCTGDISLQGPVRIRKTSWIVDPLFRGTYTYGSLKPDLLTYINDLAQPLCDPLGIPRVLFAGEATHETGYSTVHGARFAGLREAQRLIDQHK